MSDEFNPNRTVFQPSPLQGLKGRATSGPAPAEAAPRLPPDDDIPAPLRAIPPRNVMMEGAGKLLTMAAGVRAGRIQIDPAALRAEAEAEINRFDRAIAGRYPLTQQEYARYALCATVDDIVQNLPGDPRARQDWARNSLVVRFFRENVGGERFWEFAENILRRPADNADLIELYHACLAAGFEGRERLAPDGRRRLHEAINALYAQIPHARGLRADEIVPHWRGEPTPVRQVGFWSQIAFAAGLAFGLLVLLYVLYQLVLFLHGRAAGEALRGFHQPALSRAMSPALPPAREGFLQPQIDAGLVTVSSDSATTTIRTTPRAGALFASGSDEIQGGARALFVEIGRAIDGRPGEVEIQGHTDDTPIGSLTFPDNMALSEARASAVAAVLKSQMRDPGRVRAIGLGDTRPVVPNTSPDNKAQNRRVEILLRPGA